MLYSCKLLNNINKIKLTKVVDYTNIPTSKLCHDLFVIGAGSGLRASRMAAKAGAKVAVAISDLGYVCKMCSQKINGLLIRIQ